MRTTTWAAPGRVNVIGEHTDYQGGFALPFGIAETCRATVSRIDATEVRVRSRGMSEVQVRWSDLDDPERAGLTGAAAWARYPLGVLAVLARRGVGFGAGGLDIDLVSDVPTGAGLSSSAALMCSVASAVDDLYALELASDDLVAITRDTENDYVGAPTGGMDQLASLRSVAGHALLCDMRSLETTPVPFDLDGAGLRMLVVDTKAEHAHADGAYRERRAACEQASAELGVAALRDADLDLVAGLRDPVLRRRARHVVTENARVLQTVETLRTDGPRAIGGLLCASQDSMREDFEITGPVVDLAYETIMAAGALGARMTGGGFGGCVIALVEPEAVDRTAAAVSEAFARAGHTPPFAFTEQPSPGTRRIA